MWWTIRVSFTLLFLVPAMQVRAETFVFSHLLESSGSQSQTPGTSESILHVSLPPDVACASASADLDVQVSLFRPDGTPLRSATSTDICFPCTMTLGPSSRQASLNFNDAIAAAGGYPSVPGPGYDGNGFDTYVVVETAFVLPEVDDEVLVSMETKTWTDVMTLPSTTRMKIRPLEKRVQLGATCRTFVFDHLLETAGTTSAANNFDSSIFFAYTDGDPAAADVDLEIYLFDSQTGSPFMDPVGANLCFPCTITLGPLEKKTRRLDDLLTDGGTVPPPASPVDALMVINALGGNLDALSVMAMTATSRSGPNDLSFQMSMGEEVAAMAPSAIEETVQRRLGLGNHPNPFNPRTTLSFSLAHPDQVVVRIVDSRGRVVRTLRRDDVPAGDHELMWDGRDDQGHEAPSGIYFAELSTSDATTSHKMALLR